ncbi:DUF1493 family protein [Paraburkholderia sp. T12-10]|jgi:hypothetical protein|nr:DUF1493 family protein [Paraburkholderia sp. T12-10]
MPPLALGPFVNLSDFVATLLPAHMHAWAERFNVDISGFDVAYYVPSANMRKRDVVLAALKSPFSTKARESLGGRVLTLAMLEDAMKRGRWEQG